VWRSSLTVWPCRPLDIIEAEMKDAPKRLQWAMNPCLAQTGIGRAEHRRAIAVGRALK